MVCGKHSDNKLTIHWLQSRELDTTHATLTDVQKDAQRGYLLGSQLLDPHGKLLVLQKDVVSASNIASTGKQSMQDSRRSLCVSLRKN